jgi:D-alanine-D-alanine ligase
MGEGLIPLTSRRPENGSPICIGLTYDLRDDYLKMGFGEEETAEFDRPSTIAAIETTLKELGFKTDCIGNLHALLPRILKGERWDLVFNIAEGMYGLGREAQVPALLDAFRIPYTFSDAAILALTLNKALTKRIVRDLGVPTPDFLLVEKMKDLETELPPFPLFAKPLAEGTGKGITEASKITNLAALTALCRELLERFRQPVLVESFLPGREFTVGVVGTGVDAYTIGTMEVLLTTPHDKDVYSYTNKENSEIHCDYKLLGGKLAARCSELALAVWRGLGCRDAGRVDFRCTAKGEPNFLEINPLAGIHPEHSDLPILCSLSGVSYRELMGSIITSALARVEL